MVLSPTLDDAFAPAEAEGARGRPVGWAISLLVHALAAFFLLRQLTTLLPPEAPIVPVDVVELAQETVSPGPAPVHGIRPVAARYTGRGVLPSIRKQARA